APRPRSVGPSTNSPSCATNRSNSSFGAFFPQPTHVRIASWTSASALLVSFVCGRARNHLLLGLPLFLLLGLLHALGTGDRDGPLDLSPRASRSARAVCAGMPQKRVPGIAAFGQRFPLERIAAQRPEKSSPASPPAKAAPASAAANSASDWMSTFHPVRRAARRAFKPSLPIASASWSSGTMTVASLV